MRIHRLIMPILAVFLFIIPEHSYGQLRWALGPSAGYYVKSDAFSSSNESIGLGYTIKAIGAYSSALRWQVGISGYPSSEAGSIEYEMRYHFGGGKLNIDPVFGVASVFSQGRFVNTVGAALNLGAFMTLSIQDKVNLFIEPKVQIGTVGLGIFLSAGILL